MAAYEDPSGSRSLELAVELATLAISCDSENNIDAAIYYYQEAAQLLNVAQSLGSAVPNLNEKKYEYMKRVEELKRTKFSCQNQLQTKKNNQQSELERAEFLLHQAFDEDEADNNEEAIELYSQAVELCLTARKNATQEGLHAKLTNLAEKALERAEALKKKISPTETSIQSPRVPRAVSPVQNRRVIPPLGIGSLFNDEPKPKNIEQNRTTNKNQLHVSGSQSYTKEELEVLRITSFINGREYVPFMSIDLKEKFAYPLPFTDKDGKLALSPKQKTSFKRWIRPEDISSGPKIIELIDCFSIKQTLVSDCSFIASLAVSALYEKRFKRKIITSIIYPQNRAGEPVYNPCGKYMVKLHINGVPRKIIIDDYLPSTQNGELLCSYSSNRNEFWVSLLEKAYMKVMGGYDFPGSNSNIDLHALTGWIPERIAINTQDPDFNKQNLFKMLHGRHSKGDVLLSVATGELNEVEADRAGLVPTHAYAILDVKEVMGKQLFLLKNPWSHLRWKGKYSEHDSASWTLRLREALKYDPKSAKMFDNGVFWIDYDSLLHFFDVVYLNWNPSLFKYTYCIHQSWKAGTGPAKDLYSVTDNPQYSLEVKSPGSAVWILLTRHITDRDDFADNKEYITVLVYKNNGRKVYFPYDPPPFIEGIRINSPHYLCKLVIPQDGDTKYTLIISQYEKSNTIYYTLRVYATCPFTLNKINNYFKYKQEIKNGEWTSETAGGCGNHPKSYHRNPIYQVSLQSNNDENQLLIDLKGPKQYQVGFDVVTVSVNNTNASGYFSRNSSGTFRSGFTILELNAVPAGTYNIIPCTYMPNQKGPFFLTVQSTCPFKISKLQ
ncbi:calpain-7-like [Centruroides vittatus]|uniref:calpain-7-like n=1 Tax=Centruroides vittatus TaxID=120091 RepID=UPI00350EF7DB